MKVAVFGIKTFLCSMRSMQDMIRQPIVTIMGHVDHGKTTLLDTIRGSAIAAREAGGITQAIGASIIPLSTIQTVCGNLLEKLQFKITLPGLLFIDTPGHAAFVNLRKRGGNLADIAILVVDINEGLMPQTKESIEILKQYKTPFIVAANKIDLVDGWRSQKMPMVQSLASQSPQTIQKAETKLYELVGQLFEMGLNADRFDRVSDYTKQIALVPVSAKSGEGIPELLMMLTGLAQRFLEKKLETSKDSPGKGTILEVKEQKGLGKVLDVIIYDGRLSVNDQIIIGTLGKPISTRVKALFEPSEHQEMREKKAKFDPVKSVTAATGVRVVALDVENAVAGMPLIVSTGDDARVMADVMSEVGEVVMESDGDGIIAKADSLGSLEALVTLLRQRGITVRKTGIGPISKKDLSDAEAIAVSDPLHGVVLAFNLEKPELQSSAGVFVHDVIYRLIDDYDAWKQKQQKALELSKLDRLVKPCKLELLKGYVFRQNNPAIVGVEIANGTLRSNTPLMNKEGRELTVVKGIQLEQENVDEAQKGKRVAISLPGVTVGRQLNEGDIIYSMVSEEDFRQYKDHKEHLSDDVKLVLKEIAEIMRQKNPMWGV